MTVDARHIQVDDERNTETDQDDLDLIGYKFHIDMAMDVSLHHDDRAAGNASLDAQPYAQRNQDQEDRDEQQRVITDKLKKDPCYGKCQETGKQAIKNGGKALPARFLDA